MPTCAHLVFQAKTTHKDTPTNYTHSQDMKNTTQALQLESNM